MQLLIKMNDADEWYMQLSKSNHIISDVMFVLW